VGIPTAITIAGFRQIIKEVSGGSDGPATQSSRAISLEWEYDSPDPGWYAKTQRWLHDMLCNRSSSYGIYSPIVALLIVANVLACMVDSVPSIRSAIPSSAFEYFEAVSVAVFTFEFVGRLICAPLCCKEHEGYSSRLGYLASFYGLIDVVAIAPWYIEVIVKALGLKYEEYEMFIVFRVFRIFQIEHFVGAFTKLDDALRRCKSNLAAFGLVALMIWVCGGTLFYLFESSEYLQPIEEMRDSFDSVPSSMYFLCIFLGGERGLTDFSAPGKLLCIVLVLIGIELYAIPVSVLFDAFAEVLDESAETSSGPSWVGRVERLEIGDDEERAGLLGGLTDSREGSENVVQSDREDDGDEDDDLTACTIA